MYIESKESLLAEVETYCNIIAALQAAIAAGGFDKINLDEYSLDTGQTKIMKSYRSPVQIADSLLSFNKLKQLSLNKLNGRVMSARDAKGLQ